MRFRPCIDIHNGKVKQIVGGSLTDNKDLAKENFVSEKGADFYAKLYSDMDLPGGHVILLNSKDSPYYEATLSEGLNALRAAPGLLQIGGGVTAENAGMFLEAGASHVIVTSFVFKDGAINYDNLKTLVDTVGKESLVLDLSCKKRGDDYYIVTDRWQNFTDVKLTEATLDDLSSYCDEFLIHAADVEGKQNGIEEQVATMLGAWSGIPVTYAGGIRSIDDILKLKHLGSGKLDFTVGSALSLFGGHLEIKDIMDSVSC
jgi:phosphoribosylformimino-5-aminoimidazole carboxamide ribotide isomerase